MYVCMYVCMYVRKHVCMYVYFCHIYQIKLWEMNSRSFLLAHVQDIVGIIAILLFLFHVFDSIIESQYYYVLKYY